MTISQLKSGDRIRNANRTFLIKRFDADKRGNRYVVAYDEADKSKYPGAHCFYDDQLSAMRRAI